LWKQAVVLFLDHGVAFAGALLESGAINDRDVAALVADQSGLLQVAGGFSDALAAHAEHVGDQLLRHRQLIGIQPIQAQQQPPAELLIQRVMAVAYRCLGHLGDQGLKAQESAADATEAHRQQLKHMAIVAHELRNPLTPLRIAAGLLINRNSTGEIPVERLQVIINGQVTCMTRLIDDLLDASRLSTSTLRIERSDIDLGSILNQVAASCRPGMELRQQHFSMCIRPEPIRMFGDPMRLAQIFSNLLDNASKYTPEKGEIALELVLLDTCAVITVRDNGIGISAEALPTIFDLFVQDARALPHSSGGLGIGLSVVRDLVQAHGGSVVAHSVGRGRGSDFVVTLPLSGC